MGVKSYLREIEILQIGKEFKVHKIHELYLGKLLAYLSPTELSESEVYNFIKYLDKNKEDKAYFREFEDIGYCGESITLNQIFTGTDALNILLSFDRDKDRFKIFPYEKELLQGKIQQINMKGFYLFEIHGA